MEAPGSRFFFWWAYNASEPNLKLKWDLIPLDTQILVLHGPPYGIGDKAPRVNDVGYEHTGSPSLTEKLKTLTNLKLVIWGHIHGEYGVYKMPELPNTILANVSLMNDKYQPVNKPMVFDLEI